MQKIMNETSNFEFEEFSEEDKPREACGLFGIHGRQEAGPSFRCADPASKKVLWDERRFGCATMALADDKIDPVQRKHAGETFRDIAHF